MTYHGQLDQYLNGQREDGVRKGVCEHWDGGWRILGLGLWVNKVKMWQDAEIKRDVKALEFCQGTSVKKRHHEDQGTGQGKDCGVNLKAGLGYKTHPKIFRLTALFMSL